MNSDPFNLKQSERRQRLFAGWFCVVVGSAAFYQIMEGLEWDPAGYWFLVLFVPLFLVGLWALLDARRLKGIEK